MQIGEILKEAKWIDKKASEDWLEKVVEHTTPSGKRRKVKVKSLSPKEQEKYRPKKDLKKKIKEKKKQLKHVGTKEEADEFSRDSKVKDTVSHGTTEEFYNKILSKGFSPGKRGAVFFDKREEGPLTEIYGAGKTLSAKINVKNVIHYDDVSKYIKKMKSEGITPKGEKDIHKYLKTQGIDAIERANEIAVLDPKNIMIIKD